MSLFPYIFQEYSRPSPLYGLRPEHVIAALNQPQHHLHSPWRVPHRQVSRVHPDKNKFQLCLDVHQFTPEEISVKTVDRQIVVECKHDERPDDHGSISRHFVRKYDLPEGYEPNDVVSSLSSDGILTITAPRDPIILPDANERIVPIMQAGPCHYAVRDHKVDHEAHKDHHKAKKEPEVILAIKYI